MDLLSLPPEVLLQVFDVLRTDGDIDSLRASLLVCRTMQGVAERALYHTIAFRKRSSMQVLARALEADPRRLRYIQDLELQWSTLNYEHGGIQPPDIAAMLNLRRLLSESPECQPWALKNGGWKPDMQNCLNAFQEASLRSTITGPRPLEHLLSLTLHWSGDGERFWSVTPSCPIFLHPTLREIKLSCVSIVGPEGDDDTEWGAGLDEFCHKTALESLHFEESLVSPRALERILSLPKSLKRFMFQEVSHHRPGVARFIYELIGFDNNTLNAALVQQANSLEHLALESSKYLRASQSSPADIVLSLGDFRNLKSLELGYHLLRRNEPWMLMYPLPPYLERFRVTEFRPEKAAAVRKSLISMLRVDELIKNAHARNHLFHLDIWLPSIHFRSSLELDANFTRLEPIINALDGKMLRGPAWEGVLPLSSGIPDSALEEGIAAPQPWPRVSIVSVKKMGDYIPPYLHGERRPEYAPLFDTHDGFLTEELFNTIQGEIQRGMGGEAEEWEVIEGVGEEEDDSEEGDSSAEEEDEEENDENDDAGGDDESEVEGDENNEDEESEGASQTTIPAPKLLTSPPPPPPPLT
ncbi:hypothetical protein Micbo1qcDRAFT_232210 [Microdochium bolleyi]|uniref:Uncharacterized protein n=1 Tax=Microdochium bolleyi TaxID=196109 RepID=A0A136JCB8_9PEZI|nr:hypothetical protein Micbo1qcDRAFT_232210 [Microdochium bolleyi]